MDQRLKFALPGCGRFRGEDGVGGGALADAAGRGAGHGAGHVLPDQEAELVAPVVEARGFDLDVLAHHVKAELLEGLDIGAQGLVGGRGVEAVGPPALVERADLEERLVVEEDAVGAGGIGLHFDAAHAEVALHRVAGFQADIEIVERGRIGRPEVGLAEGEFDFAVGLAGDAAHFLAAQARDGGEIRRRPPWIR